MSADRFEAVYRVRFDEATPAGTLRTSGVLRYAQDVAWQHSEALGLDRAWYASRGLTWLVRGAEIGVLRDAPMGIRVGVSTEVVGYRKVWARRRSEIRDPAGELAAWVHTDWLLIDPSGRPTRIPTEIGHLLSAQLLSEPLARVEVGSPPPNAIRRRLVVRQHELDPLAHVNNAVYVDWLEEAIRATATGWAVPLDTTPREYRLEYPAAAEPHDELDVTAWRDGAGWSCLVERDGAAVLRATAVADAE